MNELASHVRAMGRALAIWAALALTAAAFAQPTETDRRAAEKQRQRQAEQRAKQNQPPETADGAKTPDSERTRAAPDQGVFDSHPASSWTIALAVFRGEGHAAQAREMLARVRTQGLLSQARAEQRGPSTLICLGSFVGPDDGRAREELKRVQELVIDGVRPYLAAYLAPPAQGALEGLSPKYNLVRARQTLDPGALYTLQIGVYGRRDLPRPGEADLRETRRAAEEAALRLRQEGEQAFYYHGPRMSMVTIGLYNQEDFDPQTPGFKSPRLLGAQRRFPHNLYNGKGVKEKLGGQPDRIQPSNLVAIPTVEILSEK